MRDVGSCSDDGKVVISGLYTNETQEYVYLRPVTCLALDPDFHRKRTRQFVSGGKSGQLVLNSKGWFGSRDTVLHSGEGAVHAVKWRGPLIAWANDSGVKVYDTSLGQRITYIDRPKGSPRPDLYRANLCWESDTSLIVAWADMLKIGQVREKLTPAGQTVRFVEIVCFFQLDYMVSGVAPFGNEHLVVLAYLVEEDPQEKGRLRPQRPELRVVSRLRNEEVSSDALTIHGYESAKATDYQLARLSGESLFYIIAPKDIVVARPRDLDDHIAWLLERERYEEALQAAERAPEAQLKEHRLVDIGERYLGHLLDTARVDEAARLAPKVLARDAKLWEKWIYRFAKMKQLAWLSPYIPVGNPQLSERVYEMVLSSFLASDHAGFKRTIQEWPSGIYNIQNVIKAVRERIKASPDADVLMDALALLYTYDRQYDQTLHIYLRLRRRDVFELIQKHDLFDSIQDKVLLLLQVDQAEAIRLLVANVHRVPMQQVVAQLREHPPLLHQYLHAVFVKDARLGEAFHELQVELYAEYDRKNLLPFLHQSTAYPLEKAYRICEARQLYPEMVHILGRMGNTKQALALLIERIGDVRQAIEFVQARNDEELWEDLIQKSMDRPAFIAGLLEHIGGHVDPIRLVARIPNRMVIPGLRDRLVKIISDYNLQTSLREGCNDILKQDCVDLSLRLNRQQRRALRVERLTCATCQADIEPAKSSAVQADAVVAFFCQHSYHARCLRAAIQHANQSSAATAAAADTLSPQQRKRLKEQELLEVKRPAAAAAAAAAGVAAAASAAATAAGVVAASPASHDADLWCILCQHGNAPQRAD